MERETVSGIRLSEAEMEMVRGGKTVFAGLTGEELKDVAGRICESNELTDRAFGVYKRIDKSLKESEC